MRAKRAEKGENGTSGPKAVGNLSVAFTRTVKVPCPFLEVPGMPLLGEELEEVFSQRHAENPQAPELSVQHQGEPECKGASDESSMKSDVTLGKRSRKRGRRGRGQGAKQKDGERVVEVWCLNSSGAPQLRAALNHASQLKGSGPVALLSQEHHACVDRLVDLQAQAKQLGWRIAPAPAVKTQGIGRSAGVGVCTPLHVPAGRREGEGWDWSPSDSPGRAVATWAQGVLPCGVYMASCYLHDMEGGTERNILLLASLLGKLRATRCPWIIGLDAQQEPNEFARWAGPLLAKVGGRIVSAGCPTFFPGVGRSKELDFFLMDEALVSSVRAVGTVSEFKCMSKDSGYTTRPSPHRLVWVSLVARGAVRLKQVLQMPKGFDRKKTLWVCACPLCAQGAMSIALV